MLGAHGPTGRPPALAANKHQHLHQPYRGYRFSSSPDVSVASESYRSRGHARTACLGGNENAATNVMLCVVLIRVVP